MELIENLLQLLTDSSVRYFRVSLAEKVGGRRYFLLLCFYGCFALGALYWTLYLLLFDTTPRVFYVSEFGWVASVIFLTHFAGHADRTNERSFHCRRAWLCACVRRAAAGVLLHFRGHFLQPDLVRHDDMALLLRHSRACLCENGRRAQRGICGGFTSACCALCTQNTCCGRRAASGRIPPASPNFWCDMLLTLAILGLLPATREAVEA